MYKGHQQKTTVSVLMWSRKAKDKDVSSNELKNGQRHRFSGPI